MQRKEIDRDEYESIRCELTGVVEIIGPVSTVEGHHEDHGEVILIRQAGRFFVDARDASLIRKKFVPAPDAISVYHGTPAHNRPQIFECRRFTGDADKLTILISKRSRSSQLASHFVKRDFNSKVG